MALIVQKFGGSSVADTEKIRNICNIIAKAYDEGNQVVAVLSAQGDTTDDLIEKAKNINPCAPAREMDMLLSTGEQISVALAAMCMHNMGYPVISLTGWQAGIRTTSEHSCAKIFDVEQNVIRRELNQSRIVLVAGFQGVDTSGNITTLGRGGSDTTAVSLAAWLKADVCQIYTDVNGVYTADPRMDSNATKLDDMSYDELLKLIRKGAQVMHEQSVITAKEFGVEFEVRSSFTGVSGTIVHP